MNLWPWRKKPEPAPAPVDIAAIAKEAAAAAANEVARAMVAASPMGMIPVGGGQAPRGAYAFDNPYNFASPQSPTRRPQSVISTRTLRTLADTYDILRDCIQHLKREVISVPIQIVAKDAKDKSEKTAARIAEATAFFSTQGGLGGAGKRRAEFEGMVVEDLCVIGGAAVHFQNAVGGWPLSAVPIDAATIRPRVDAYGWPGPGEVVYEQWIQGAVVAGFTREEMAYTGLATQARSWTPYFASPVEWLIGVIEGALYADQWNRMWLSDGNTPSDIWALPETWTPHQVREFAEWWDGMLSGNMRERRKSKFLPAGSKQVGTPSRKDQEFGEYELWLMRRCCAVMGVQPASIGFAGEQYKVSQEGSMEQTTQFGAGDCLEHRKATYDDILERLGYPELEAENVTKRAEAAKERAERSVSLVGGGVKTPNEARQEEGLEPIEGGDTLFLPSALRPIEQALEPPQAAVQPVSQSASQPADRDEKAERAAMRQWERKAINRLRAGKPADAAFESDELPPAVRAYVAERLPGCADAMAVRALFRQAESMESEEAEERTDWAARVSAELEALAGVA